MLKTKNKTSFNQGKFIEKSGLLHIAYLLLKDASSVALLGIEILNIYLCSIDLKKSIISKFIICDVNKLYCYKCLYTYIYLDFAFKIVYTINLNAWACLTGVV